MSLRSVGWVAAFIIASAASVFAQSLPPGSTWVNQRQSVLVIDSVDANGKFRGRFTNQAPNFSCKGIQYAASGQVTGNDVTFLVNFIDCNTVTVWYGTVSGQTLSTKWDLAYIDDSKTPYQLKILSDQDMFTKQ